MTNHKSKTTDLANAALECFEQNQKSVSADYYIAPHRNEAVMHMRNIMANVESLSANMDSLLEKVFEHADRDGVEINPKALDFVININTRTLAISEIAKEIADIFETPLEDRK
jgi:ElaB/YqjD/DUF883 family membrane-anchored ribosome-binding protein